MAATQNRVLRSGFWTLQGRLPGGVAGEPATDHMRRCIERCCLQPCSGVAAPGHTPPAA
jgi:hypothetical protein